MPPTPASRCTGSAITAAVSRSSTATIRRSTRTFCGERRSNRFPLRPPGGETGPLMLQVRGLSVEVGGRLTLEEASFTVAPGDKVGLVGRNGAGKTSLLRVLGGESQPAAGHVIKHGQVGYLNQDPRSGTRDAATTALTHVLSGRGLDDAILRLEKLRLTMEEDPSTRNVTRFSKAQEAFESSGGYSAEADVRRIVAGLGLTSDRVDLPITVLSGGERRRVELARILFAGSDILLLDEP